MIKIKYLYYLSSFTFISFLFSTQGIIELQLSTYNNIKYINLDEFIDKHNAFSSYYETKDKLEITYKKNKIYFSPSISYCKINNQIYNLTYPIVYKKKAYYVPANKFYEILEMSGLPLRIHKQKNGVLFVNPNIFNINDLTIKNKNNGTLVTFSTSKEFKKADISSSFSSSNWLNITILNCY